VHSAGPWNLPKTTRRTFLRILAGTTALISGRSAARPSDSLPQIHSATRNTRFGPVGRRTGKAGPPFKRYPDAPWRALPTSKLLGRSLGEVLQGYVPSRRFGDTELTVDQLSALLYHTNGVTGHSSPGDPSRPLRAAPSAGAYYAGEVYVVVERVRGVSVGLYYYRTDRHRLIQLRTGSHMEQVSSSLERPDRNAAIAVILTNVFGRYTRHYANRGYRYALIDSGHIGENLRLTARSLGTADVSPVRFWDDRLNELLRVDGRTEAVCAVHLVGVEGSETRRIANGSTHFVEVQNSAGAVGPGSEIERFHQGTKLVPSNQSVSTTGADAGSTGRATDGIALPIAEPLRMSVHAAIRERRSAHGFDRRPITLDQLGSVLRAAGGDAALKRAADVEIFAVAHRVARLEPGVYRYVPEVQRLVPIRTEPLAEEMVAACLKQRMAGSAAVGFVMATHSDACSSKLGDRRYRDALLESGAIAQRIYLAAGAVGLGARNLAAFRDDRFNEILRLDRQNRFALHLTMMGHVRERDEGG
jgi:SagB-type dehydrogenase family enzyme